MNDLPSALADLYRLTNDCVVIFDVQSARRFVVASLNPAAASTFALDPAFAQGKPTHEIWPAAHADALARSFQLALDGPTTAEHLWPLPGGPRWFLAHMVPLRYEGHPPLRLVVSWRDISAQKAYESALCEREGMFRRLVETSGVIPWEAEPNRSRFMYVGPQAYERFGYPRQEWHQEGFWERIIHPDDRAEAVRACAELARRSSEFSFQYRLVTQAGEVVWVQDQVNVAADKGRTLLRGFLIEVTARHEAEQQVRRMNETLEARVSQRTVQLAATNAELEAFCYSVSHDLRAPLRAIDGFSKALLEDYEHSLDDDGRDMLGRVRAASQRMGELIDDLLTLSRVTRAEMRRSRVNLSSIAAAVAADLHRTAPRRQVEWVIAPGQEAEGDPAWLRVLLENLLGNAWKYTSKHASARIEFGHEEIDGVPAFFVRDDGAGFDPRYAGKLFEPFKRLHPPEEFEGHGVGLATVRRVAQRHGGRAWAVGEVEKGATVYFTCDART